MQSQGETNPSAAGKTRAFRRLMGAGLLGVIAVLASLVPAASAQSIEDEELLQGRAGVADDSVLIESGPIVGTNGIFVGPDDNLWVASVFGGHITKLDPDTGEVLEVLGPDEGVFFPDDVTVGPDGTVYWTEIVLNGVFKRTPQGETVPLAELLTANPITLSEDGTRLFAAGCYNQLLDLVEIDPINGGIVQTIIEDHPGCASNAMDLGDGETALYSPRPFEGRVVRVDIATGEETNVTVDYAVPIAVKFNNAGELYAASQGTGEVVRIDLDNPDPTANREVVAEFPIGWIDNIAFTQDDRLFVSSATDGAIVEVLEDGTTRTVVPGTYTLPLGLGLIGDELITANGQQLLRFDKRTGELNSVFRSIAGVGPLPFISGLTAWGDRVIATDLFTSQVQVIDPFAPEVLGVATVGAPIDTLGFGRKVLVSDISTGEVVQLDGGDLSRLDPVAQMVVPTGLAGDGHDAYAADFAMGTVVQIIDDGEPLATPRVIAADLAGPEGLTLHDHGKSLVVVEGVTGTVTHIDIATGAKSTIGLPLNFQPGNPAFPFGFFNDVTSDGDAVFVAADGSNTIHRFDMCAGMTAAMAEAAGYNVIDRSDATRGQLIFGTAGKDWILGSEKGDVIFAGAGADAVCSRGARDIVSGGQGRDVIDAGKGRDFASGGAGRDTVYGGLGPDFLAGGIGNDVLAGGPGNDVLRGNRGNDTLTGGAGNDAMRGGLGRDVCTDVMPGDRARSC